MTAPGDPRVPSRVAKRDNSQPPDLWFQDSVYKTIWEKIPVATTLVVDDIVTEPNPAISLHPDGKSGPVVRLPLLWARLHLHQLGASQPPLFIAPPSRPAN